MNDDPKREPSNSEDAHPLASPTELAGSTEGAINAEFAARDAAEAGAEQAEADSLPLDGE